MATTVKFHGCFQVDEALDTETIQKISNLNCGCYYNNKNNTITISYVQSNNYLEKIKYIVETILQPKYIINGGIYFNDTLKQSDGFVIITNNDMKVYNAITLKQGNKINIQIGQQIIVC